MATETTNFQYILPDIGGDDFAWGTMLNDNWIKADAQFKTLNDTFNARTISTNNGLTGGGNLSANRTLGLTGQALALHNHTTNGILVRTASATYASRSIAGGSGITVTNGNGVSGDPSVAVDDTVVRTSGAQNIGGNKNFTGTLFTSSDASSAIVFRMTDSDGTLRAQFMATGANERNLVTRVFDAAGVQTGQTVLYQSGDFVTSGRFSGNGSLLTALNASNLASGTVADARLPSNIVRHGRAINTGDGLTGGGDLTTNRSLAVDSTVARRNDHNTFSGSASFVNSVNVSIQTTGGNAHYWMRNLENDAIGLLFTNAASRITSMRAYGFDGSYKEAAIRATDGRFTAPSFEGDGSRLTNVDMRDAPVGGVGTFALLTRQALPNAAVSPGATEPGSNLRYSSAEGTTATSPVPAGTWRLMGSLSAGPAAQQASLWLRIS